MQVPRLVERGHTPTANLAKKLEIPDSDGRCRSYVSCVHPARADYNSQTSSVLWHPRSVEVTDTIPDPANDAHGAETPMHPHLVVALECDRPLAGGLRVDLKALDEVVIGRGPERTIERSDAKVVLRVPGGAMSATHARLVREGGDWVAHDLRSTNGMVVNGRPATTRRLCAGDVLELGHTLFLFPGSIPTPAGTPPIHDSASRAPLAEGLSTLMPRFEQELLLLPSVAASPLPVLILGETGTGKELLARAVHTLSRRPGPIVPVNCAAIPAALLESQVFGHCRGAFSGADRDHPGLVRAAEGGTLFLDEIGDLTLPAQGTLLRVLQEREVLPVGATQAVKVDVRIVAATHRNLRAMVEAGAFRADLLARLEGAIVHAPPVRERRADLGLLVASLLRRVAGGRAARITFDARAGLALALHAWPANVRELEQALGRAVVTAGEVIRLENLPATLAASLARRLEARPESAPTSMTLREGLELRLREEKGNVAAVARALGKAPAQIHRWMRRFGIDPNDFRGGVDHGDP
jgi:transcriptional regulator with AAA-type ATPase domain